MLFIWLTPHLAKAQDWQVVSGSEIDFSGGLPGSPPFYQAGFSLTGFGASGGSQDNCVWVNNFQNNSHYLSVRVSLSDAYEYRFSWNARTTAFGKQLQYQIGVVPGSPGTNIGSAQNIPMVSSFGQTADDVQSAVFSNYSGLYYYLIVRRSGSGGLAPTVRFDNFKLERRLIATPTLAFQQSSATIAEGDSVQICVSVATPSLACTADVVLTSSANPHLSSFTTQTLSFPADSSTPQCFMLHTEPANGQPDLNHSYTLELQNLTGGAMLGEATAMTVNVTDDTEMPEGCPWAGADTTICAGECVYIGCLPLSEENGLCYRWFPDQDISSTYSPYPEVCPDTTTTYIIYITDDQGNLVGSDTVIVTVNPLPVVEITPPNPAICLQTPPGVVAPGGRNNVCSVEPITLSTVETYAVYNWSTGATGPNITVVTPGPYRVTVTDATGCTASKEVELAYCTEVTLEVSPTPAQLCEDTLILQANAGFESYLWSDNSTGSSLIVTEPGTYSVTVQDAGGCFAVEVIEVPYCAATDIDMTIFNGLYDWLTRDTSLSGGQPISEDREVRIGAVTLANLNNTDGDYLADGTTERIDVEDDDVERVNNSVVGRNEIDLMRLVIKKSPTLNPAVDGVIKLTKISGNVKLWWKPTKDSLVVMTSIANNLLEFTFDHNNDFLGDTMTVMYIEAIGKSAAVRDIEFQLAYEKQRDTVKATAIWAEQTKGWYARDNTPTLGNFGANENLNYFDELEFINRLNKLDVAEDGTLYGYGPSVKGPIGITVQGQGDYSNKNKRLGGRHLVEYRVYPRGANVLADSAGIQFDIARQKRVISLTYFSGDSTPRRPNVNHPYLFPWEPSMQGQNHQQRDNEFPNDDGGQEDEDVRLPPSEQHPDSLLLYSFDNAANSIKVPGVQSDDDHIAFRLTKATFSEFVRVALDTFPVAGDALAGSRASERYEWHCIHYHKRGPNDSLVIDADTTMLASYSEPGRYGMHGINGTIEIELKQGAQTRGLSLFFVENGAMSHWQVKTRANNVPTTIGNTGNNGSNGPWVFEDAQLKITLIKGTIAGSTDYKNGDSYAFNVFRTVDLVNGRRSRIAPGRLVFAISNNH
ncbi:MAG: hypothetical protein ACKV1O_20530 [Saprospiraceae bacterium]